jgi:hypothetical protein
METFTLVPNLYNPIVECYNLNVPIPNNTILRPKINHDNETSARRLIGEIIKKDDPITLYFKNILYNQVAPLFVSHEKYHWSWPISVQTFIENTRVTATLFKHEIGWSQSMHEDPRIYAASGVIHLQDCEQGTKFQSNNYIAPAKKFSGAFWANTQWSHHCLEKVTSERMGYLIIAQWKFLHVSSKL